MSPDVSLKPRSTWQNPKLACVSALVLVFLCGAAAGALAMNLGAHRSLHKSPFWTESGKAIFLERIKKDLDLSSTQTAQMESILDDFAKYYQTVLSDGKSRIFAILNDSQKRKFEQILQERSGTR